MNTKFYNLHFVCVFFFVFPSSSVVLESFLPSISMAQRRNRRNEGKTKSKNRAHEKEIETNEKSREDYQFCFGARAFRSFWSVVRILKCHCLWSAHTHTHSASEWIERKYNVVAHNIHTHARIKNVTFNYSEINNLSSIVLLLLLQVVQYFSFLFVSFAPK